MALKDFLLIEKLGSGIVSVTVALVVLLGLFIYGSVISSNPYAAMDVAPQGEDRAPASVVNLAPEIEKVALKAAVQEAQVVNLVCFNGSTAVTVESKAKQIRLRGPVCGNGSITNIEVVNRTNGYVATIFQTDKSKYSSDYIHLATGQNQLLLSYTDARGLAHSTELTVSRAQ